MTAPGWAEEALATMHSEAITREGMARVLSRLCVSREEYQRMVEERDALIDSAYYQGAKQAMAMAEQSMPVARAWVLGGCGDRAGSHAKVVKARAALKGQSKEAGDGD